MNSAPIYLDYASTTPAAPSVVEAMMSCLGKDGNFANPASRSHMLGWQAEAAVENARAQLAQLIGADPREIVWTSGATEANNLAIKGAVQAGMGVSIVSRSALQKEERLELLESRPMQPPVIRTFYFVRQRHKFRTHLMDELFQFAREYCSPAT